MATAYSPEERARLAAAVLEGMAGGLSLRKAAKSAGVAHATFLLWVSEDPELSDHYARAREDLIDGMAEDLLSIADDKPETYDSAEVAHRRLQVDARKWLLSKLAPKKYGDRVEVAGDPDAPLIGLIRRVVVDGGEDA